MSSQDPAGQPNLSAGMALPDYVLDDAAVRVMFSFADQLIPLFATGETPIPMARRMAVDAILAYECIGRADHVNAARIVAFSASALALLGYAAAQDVPIKEKMQAYGRAVAMNRSADISEQAMMQRRRYLAAHPPAERLPFACSPAEQPPADKPDAERLPPDPVQEVADTAAETAIKAAVAEAVGLFWKTAAPAKALTVEPNATAPAMTPAKANAPAATAVPPAAKTALEHKTPAALTPSAGAATPKPSTAPSLPPNPAHAGLPHVGNPIAAIRLDAQIPEAHRRAATSMRQELLRTVATMPPPVAPNASLFPKR